MRLFIIFQRNVGPSRNLATPGIVFFVTLVNGLQPWTNDQCITVRQGTARYLFVHSGVLFLCIFFPYFTPVTFFMSYFFTLYFFHVALFRVALFLCCTLVKLHYFHVALVSCCILSYCNIPVMHFFHAALIPCCTLSRGTLFSRCAFFVFYFFSCCFMLHFFTVALF